MQKVREGDEVWVRSGKDKGRRGKVLEVVRKPQCPETGQWVRVEGINVQKEHVKPNPQRQQPGGIVPREGLIPACKVALIDHASKPSRVGIKTLEDGKKVRYFKSSGEVVDV